MFALTLYMGSHKQAMSFLLDTGSDISWLPTDDCLHPLRGCQANKTYHYIKSHTSEKSNRNFTIKYAIGEVNGSLMRDNLFLTNTSDDMIKHFEYLGIYEMKGVPAIQSDGLLGLGPTKAFTE